ncbi:hypothetical protein V8C37DRAFT_414963 [Trichoderma ceciliae]
MGDSGWMRLLPGQRCRTPVSPWIPYEPNGNEDTVETTALKTAPRPFAILNQSPVDSGGDIFVREADRLQNTPSVDEMADMLRTTIMISPTPPILDPQYTSYVLHLIEGYSKIRNALSAQQKAATQLEAQRQEDKERSKALVAGWSAQELRYKAEIKRLELIIQQVSGKGVEAVALARSGSLIRRGGTGRGDAAETMTSEGVAAEELCHDEYEANSPCNQSVNGQVRRTSTSSDTFDLTTRLNTKRQLWRHRSENNLLEPSQRAMAGQKEHRQGQLLSHLASPHLRLALGASKLETEEECSVDDEERLVESDVGDSE